MEKDILAKLSMESLRFSKGQRSIAKYIVENYEKAAYMTAGKLAKSVGVSESTVVRFATELGYEGYPAMRKALQDMIHNRLTSVQRIEVARELINGDRVIETVLRSDVEKIATTLEECDRESFEKAVDAIISAREIYVVGTRSSSCLASFLGYYLNLMLPNVHLLQDTAVSEAYEQIFRIKKGDLLIGISYPRYSSRTMKAMKFAKSSGATVVGITDGESSPFVDVADILLFAKCEMVSFLDSLVAPLSLINALIVSVGAKSEENISQTFRRLESVWAEYDVYEQVKS